MISPKELIARIRAALKRARPVVPDKIIMAGSLEIVIINDLK
jgi:DNA-binding response OmpR family regulator